MRKIRLILLAAFMMIIAVSCGQNNKVQTLNISAAASLSDALTEISEEYKKENDIDILFNFAGSGTLKTQISEGADCDIFISASKEHMNELEEKGLIDEPTREDLLGNTLTLIASEEAKDRVSLESLNKSEVGSISIGTPDSVPAGKYAMQVFEEMNIKQDIENKLVFAKDVRGVLDYVETGNVDCGLVYKTDALLLKSGLVICDIPNEMHSPIIYPISILKEAKNKEMAEKFIEFLHSDKAMIIFEKYGFVNL